MEKIVEDIIKKIEAQLKIKGMTQADYSLVIGHGPQWFTKLKSDERDFKITDLVKTCEMLGINSSDLLPSHIISNPGINLNRLFKEFIKAEIKSYHEENGIKND